jgi:uncharacterized protein
MQNFNKIYFFGIILILVFIIFYTFSSQKKTDEYTEKLLAERRDKNELFRSSEKSPILNRQTFSKLEYFPPNPAFRFKARLELIPDSAGTLYAIKMTDGKTEKYRRYAWAVFRFQGKDHRLLVLRPVAGEDYLFIAFRDRTSSESTYGGGRYIDMPPTDSPEIMLDFNLAYNPYCAYNPNYSCPLPPRENRLDIAVEAGEKTAP